MIGNWKTFTTGRAAQLNKTKQLGVMLLN